MVLYVREIPPNGGWQDVLAADTKNPAQPIIYLARTGRMLVDRQARTHPDGAAGRRAAHDASSPILRPTRC